ncbi:hypothetical protein E1B28_010999 [Marasmius oreades]|uniref:RING-type domain-containing protein n=1 Tax=Marasmius oreades TaxID=181124 RepID=A0A9P7RU78_9AGAR|nr:uncharacterized protein E1B28_010999 [Marasmius oreades]KAG7089301.1 hypothetical protein E1B28_010999 [Marasmius oreades]
MLVSHSSGECDVCFKTFKTETKSLPLTSNNAVHPRHPHVLHCGHVFCKRCLDLMEARMDRKCPLCRATFDRTDIRKLHLECFDDRADVLLQILNKAWDEEHGEHLNDVIAQVEEFLDTKGKHECLGLRIALRAFYEHLDDSRVEREAPGDTSSQFVNNFWNDWSLIEGIIVIVLVMMMWICLPYPSFDYKPELEYQRDQASPLAIVYCPQ